MLEKLAPSAEETATQWVRAFGLALTSGDEAALAKFFLPDSHWRNLFGISWQLATSSGNENLCHELSRRASEVRASEFRVDTTALAPRQAVVAGREVIEAIICFDTSHGPGIGAIGLDALVIDQAARVGDNWRLRYHGLKLHNKTPVNHLRYLPFPPTFPDYIPKDKIANWLESYVDIMEINFWTGTTFDDAEYDETEQRWTAHVRRTDGTARTLRPRHIVLATSVSGTPNIPKIETLENFAGKVLHSSQFAGGKEWGGQSAVVLGTGTSAHDICQELQAHGAEVTMVQRSPTMVVNVDPSAQLYDRSYLGDGPPIDIRDTLNSGMPLAVIKASHKLITNEVKKLDAALLQRLENVGFRLEFGEDGTGWPLKFRTRGGGYYFNVGCSELIADRKIRLIQATDIKRFTANGLQLGDGSTLSADLVVLATGYKGLDHVVASRFGEAVAAGVGPIWGFDDKTQELRNMWTRTRQPGLWFTGGAFSQCRIYSRYIALQIDAIEAGKLAK